MAKQPDNIIEIIDDLLQGKVGLALGSGGAKGLSHIGVIEFLEKNDIYIDFIAGSSIGGIIAAIYAFGKLEQFKNDILKLELTEILGLADPVFPRYGLIKGNKIFQFLARYIPENAEIQDASIPLAIVATEFHTGQAIGFTSGNVHNALRASIAIPGIFIPASVGDKLYIDGGISNPLPIDLVKTLGADKVIAVNLQSSVHQQKHKRHTTIIKEVPSSKNSMKPIIAPAKKEVWYKRIFKRNIITQKSTNDMPPIYDVITRSMEIFQNIYVRRLLADNEVDVLIEPKVKGIRTLDFRQVEKTIAAGHIASIQNRKSLVNNFKRLFFNWL